MAHIPLIGYTDRWSAAPGERIDFKVSCTSAQPFSARLVRVVSCDPSPEGPGIIEHAVPADFTGSYPSKLKTAQTGSYVRVPLAGTGAQAMQELRSFTAAALVWPTTPGLGLQGVLSYVPEGGQLGFSLAIGADGAVATCRGAQISVGKALIERRWYRVWLSFDAESGSLSVGQVPLNVRIDADDAGEARTEAPAGAIGPGRELLIAALVGEVAGNHFNGKIEAPRIVGQALDSAGVADVFASADVDGLVAAWDFSQKISTAHAVDVGPHRLDGDVVNLPTRAVTGAAWDASVQRWSDKPAHYGAIHFHDDDIYDCGWETDFHFTIPTDLHSGVYAARLRSEEGDEDMIPFFVTAPIGQPRERVAVLIPTFTYTVYANISRGNVNASLRETVRRWGAWPHNADDHQEYGLSTYNYHHDGSGIGYSSRRRPNITMRSATVCYPDVPGSGLRHFAADAHLWYWLETLGYAFDVITDDELHTHGRSAIEGYDVVMTTTHPEYHTKETLDAIEAYTGQGGQFMYLGGNGFYWKVAVCDGWPGAVEIRRGEGGIRMWAAEPGEYYNAFDGTYGGLWRRNGRPPQALAGVGFTSQGGHRGDGYRRTPASYEPDHAWVFAGIDEALIGDFGLAGGGAAGFELDRADARLGTPRNAVVLATSEGHGDHFVVVPEDVLSNLLSWNGEPFDDLIRADIVYFDTPGNGAVFSVGSITFCGSLPVNECDNNISRMLRNVLDRFLSA